MEKLGSNCNFPFNLVKNQYHFSGTGKSSYCSLWNIHICIANYESLTSDFTQNREYKAYLWTSGKYV